MTDREEPAEAAPVRSACAPPSADGPFSSRHYVFPRQSDAPAEAAPATRASAVQEVLDGLPGSAIFLAPVYGDDGGVSDFRILAATPDAVDIGARRGKELVGLSVLETYPTVAGTEVWQGYLQALAGARYEGEPFEYEEVLAGIPRLSRFAVRATPCQGGLIVSWVRLDNGEREQRRLTVMQRLGHMGWADWDLVRNVISWSEEVYAIFGRDRALGPMTLEEMPAHVLPEDLPALGGTVRRLLAHGEAVDHTFRVNDPGGDGTRYVRIVAEGVADARGTTVEVHGFFQDRTLEKRAEEQLRAQQRAALAQRDVLVAERALAARLQHALLPVSQRSLPLAGLTVDVAYQPVQEGLNVGGDWYSAVELPDGNALLVVGDVAGHGLDAVATMAQLRFTAKGMAVTGTPPTVILDRLNTLLLHTSVRDFTTATMVLGHYDPAASRLTWVQAGHPPPLLLRDGRARYLPAPCGLLLGAAPAPRYEAATLLLRPGDHLLLYTDGLVEQPREYLDDGLARLARTAEACAADSRFLDGILDALVTPDDRRDDICVLHVSV
ncbi:SpoIIE family protein phosphatase [Streptomyces sp. NPDC001941]|uniref:PP2C family protein-serine/threonine phosphatase n=1 Tax=Streptomyces sp. NPDC001941 TaxID=3154659 RepID=UPI00331CA435